MSDDFGYCEGCGKRITRDDFGFGDAVRRGERVYCLECSKNAGDDTNVVPAPRPAPAVKPPSTRVMAASRSSRRHQKRHSSVRLIPGTRPSDSSAALPPQCRVAQVQKLAASIICPHCFEKLVVRIAGFPATHTCEVCGKMMRITAPGAGT